MIAVNGEQMPVIDSHAHVWNNFNGTRFGDTKVESLGFGMVRQGDRAFRLMPAEYQDNQAPVEVLLANMETAGVDKAVILQNPCYGDQRDYIRGILQKHPGKFVSIGMIDPRDKREVARQMDILYEDYCFKGFKIEVPDVPFIMDDPEHDFLWDKITRMGAVAVVDLGWNDGPFDFNIDRFRNVMKKFPTMRTVLCHLGVSRLWDQEQKSPYPHLQQTLSLLSINKDNLYLDVSSLILCDDLDEYPFYRCLDFLRIVKETCGLDRIMWGSDSPTVMRNCTYKQSLTCFVNHCPYVTQEEWRKVLYANAEGVYFC